jgi:hypothetical protein
MSGNSHLHAFNPGQHSVHRTCTLSPHHRPLHEECRDNHLEVDKPGKHDTDEQCAHNRNEVSGGVIFVTLAPVEGAKNESNHYCEDESGGVVWRGPPIRLQVPAKEKPVLRYPPALNALTVSKKWLLCVQVSCENMFPLGNLVANEICIVKSHYL